MTAPLRFRRATDGPLARFVCLPPSNRFFLDIVCSAVAPWRTHPVLPVGALDAAEEDLAPVVPAALVGAPDLPGIGSRGGKLSLLLMSLPGKIKKHS